MPYTAASAELYDPDDDSWTSLPSMPEPRAAGAAVTLPDGSILVLGGHRQQEAESGFETSSLSSAVRLLVGP
jgi:N-acetylneuraminic acid mutarotase